MGGELFKIRFLQTGHQDKRQTAFKIEKTGMLQSPFEMKRLHFESEVKKTNPNV